jgi:dTDP-4-dehydro-6-deoxy-alpha-D-glucopyranose 2,3-dehydratase
MLDFKSIHSNHLFLKSALCKDGEHKTTPEVLNWLSERKEDIEVKVSPCPLKEINGWIFDDVKGHIRHVSDAFFSIEGIEVKSNCLVKEEWQQPIIVQPEIGFLGIITKEFNGVLHFLLQAKIEPGNINHVQLSPTLQATRSNYTKVHKGREPLYLKYFLNAKYEQILVDQLQSEQGGRFLSKRNRNIIIKIDEDIDSNEQFTWLTLGQIKQLIQFDNVVNMDTRSVISCCGFGDHNINTINLIDFILYQSSNNASSQKLLQSALFSDKASHSLDEIFSFLTQIKSLCDLKVKQVKLGELSDWIIEKMMIRHQHDDFFKVIAVDVEIGNREVEKWSQPMIQSLQEGLCAFVMKEINGVIHFAVQAKIETGNFDIVEFAPTVQAVNRDFRKSNSEDLPFLNYVINASTQQIVFDIMQSEEGGRFYHDQNRYLLVMAESTFPELLPQYFIWMTLNQINTFIKINNVFNIQARSLVAAISFI